jgi:hypothetical protein
MQILIIGLAAVILCCRRQGYKARQIERFAQEFNWRWNSAEVRSNVLATPRIFELTANDYWIQLEKQPSGYFILYLYEMGLSRMPLMRQWPILATWNSGRFCHKLGEFQSKSQSQLAALFEIYRQDAEPAPAEAMNF